ncbi:hypothetical protein C8Q77DRAFT_1074771 [Trametes polyzona]|nr:hypothetical protein C8Q77DRAFT_1074771 [Trametes polyzona]
MNASVQSNYYLSPLPNSVLDESIGAFLIGTLLGLTLYGMVVHQTYQYFHRYKDNDIYVRSFALEIAVAQGETKEQAACGPGGITLSYLTTTTYLDGHHRSHFLWQSLSALMYSNTSRARARTPDPVGYLTPEFLNIAVAGAAVVSDLLTTGIFITSLKNSRTGFRQTDRMLDRLIRYAVYTGVLTGILLSTAIAIIVTKVYGVSVLAVLHTRRSSIEVAERGQRERIGIHVIATGTRTSSTLEDFGHIQVSHGRSDSIVTKANRAESA